LKKNILIHYKKTIRESMLLLEKTGESCLIVIDDNKKMMGTLTDGDIRRNILKNRNFNLTLKNIFNVKPKFVYESNFELKEVKKLMLKFKIDLVPILNSNKEVINYFTWEEIFNTKKKNKVFVKSPQLVIMAGGRGTRLRPFTNVLPKPLIPVGDKTIIEIILDSFSNFGINKFFISINHKSHIIKSFFKELNFNYKVKFVEEDRPLGTAGSLRKLDKKISSPFFLTNCDTLTKVNYLDLMNFHKKNKFLLTLVASSKDYKIPYGVCELDEEGNLKKIREKLKSNYLVNVGLYVLSPEVLKMVPRNQSYDITDLIKDIKKRGYKVGIYPVHESLWRDVGEWDSYKKAVENL